MSSSHIAILGKLLHADWKAIGQVLEDALETDCPRDAISAVIEKRIASGMYVIHQPLSRLIIGGRSASLYEKVRDQLCAHTWSLIALYQGRYPDPVIEEKLCSELYKIAFDDAAPARGFIVDAMRDVGTQNVLPTLEAIASDIAPSAKVLEVFSAQLDTLGAMQAGARVRFMARLASAIDHVRLRENNSAVHSTTDKTSNTEAIETFITDEEEADIVVIYKRKAKTLLDADPEAAVTYIRKGSEALAKHWYRRLGYETGAKPARKMELEELITKFKDGDIPDLLKLLLRTLQPVANYGSHDQDGQQMRDLTKEMVSLLLGIYEQAVDLHLSWQRMLQSKT